MKPLLTETHIAKYAEDCFDLYHPDTGVRTIDDFVYRVAKQSRIFTLDDEKANVFKGDMLEILAEIFFGAFINDPKVGIKNYTPVALTDDYGVDATGINVAGNPVAVQGKFRGDPSEAITYEDMAKTYAAGQIRHRLPLNYDDALILFTTCNNVSKACKEVFGTKLRLIGRPIIEQRIDNNVSFWQEAEARVALTFQKLGLIG